MNEQVNRTIGQVVEAIQRQSSSTEFLALSDGVRLPNRRSVNGIIKDLRRIIFPGYFEAEGNRGGRSEYFSGYLLTDIFERLQVEIQAALCCENKNDMWEGACEKQAEEICLTFFKELPHVQMMLMTDVQAGFDGDPAAHSQQDIIFSYPGLFAIFIYRLAHVLYRLQVPYIPRMMTEYAHSGTGIDINAGAEIGESFFIDHGTGVVIGETTIIGKNVKLYQGVTLGALSTRSGQMLSGVKRHPTIEDNVTIYSGATVLGGETVIGEDSIIGGNAFITSSVPKSTRVSVKAPELTLKGPKQEKNLFDWED